MTDEHESYDLSYFYDIFFHLLFCADIDQLPNGGGKLTADSRLKSASSPYYSSGQDFENLQLTWNIEAAREDAVVTIVVSQFRY